MASATAEVQASADWTCRVLVGNLSPSSVYWYRFVDQKGQISRVGRTITAPREDDTRPVRFAFVCCQNANLGSQQAYRRMIHEDELAAESDRLGFVLHLGDFIYELVWYPEEWLHGFEGRRVRDVVRYSHGEKISGFYVPTTLDDYRAIYRAYLTDPDLQDARARWPFVCIWDNHEFSLAGWQSLENFGGHSQPRQTRKVAANQAWYEYQPARILKPGGQLLEEFNPPKVRDAPIERFDAHGFGDEPNNRAAVASLTGYRSFRWGQNVELIITDQRSYRSEVPVDRMEASAFMSPDFPQMFPQEALEILDAGQAYARGDAPATIRFGALDLPNFRQKSPPQTILGWEQKQWFLKRLHDSRASWKIWANTMGTLEARADLNNLPANFTKRWPGAGYACYQMGDFATAFLERSDIYRFVRDGKISGFVTICGNSHSFWAGLAASTLPPRPFEPVGAVFVVGSISAPGIVEYLQNTLPADHPLRMLYLPQPSGSEPLFNMLIRHGVRSCLEYHRSGSVERARELSNPELAPHLSFLDLAGHGYATVRATPDSLECEFVCIPRPAEPTLRQDGGPVRYRVSHRVPLWQAGGKPRVECLVIEGNPTLSL